MKYLFCQEVFLIIFESAVRQSGGGFWGGLDRGSDSLSLYASLGVPPSMSMDISTYYAYSTLPASWTLNQLIKES